MEFIVSSSTLSQQLSAISGVIVRNPVVPILENFLFEIGDNKLVVTASDLQISMSTTLTIVTKEKVNIAIPARILMETLKSLPEQPLTFSINKDSYGISVKSDNGHYKLAGENPNDFPHIGEVTDGVHLNIDTEVLKRAINQTIFATSNDELRPAMGGVYIDFSNALATFVATDGHRLVRYTRSDISAATQNPFIVSRKALTLLNTLLSSKLKQTAISFDSSKLFLNCGNISMIARLIDERYPDYENVIPTDYTSKLIVNRPVLLNSLKRTAIYANKTTNQVKLQITSNKLCVCSEDFDFSNEASEEIACTYNEESIEIGFNAKIFIEMLGSSYAEEIEIRLIDAYKAVLIVPTAQEKHEDLLMLIMPIIF